MTEKKDVVNPATKYGHGINRAKKTEHKDNTRVLKLKHRRKWVEDKMDNK